MLATSKKKKNFDFHNWILKTKFIISFEKIILIKYPTHFLSQCLLKVRFSLLNLSQVIILFVKVGPNVSSLSYQIKRKHKSKRKLWTSSLFCIIPSNFVSPCWNFSTHLTLILMIVRGQGFCLPGHHSNEIDT